MKKTYQEDKWKRHSKRATKRELKKRRRIQILGKQKHLSFNQTSTSYRSEEKQLKTIEAPANFSIIYNVESMLEFFNSYYMYAKKGNPIFFDLSKVTKMTEDAILYMLSQFKRSKLLYGHNSISGNTPENEECKKLFEESGFYKFVRPLKGGYIQPSNGNIFSIETKLKVDAIIAKNIVEYVESCLGKLETSMSRGLYATLIECMANTLNHAYENRRAGYDSWWVIALHRKDKNCVHLTFLDNGQGIPKTIKKTFMERLSSIIGKKDNDLISSALLGDFRTKTGQKWRGKGLPKIKQYVEKGELMDLKIISNEGYVTCNEDGINFKEMPDIFHGTLLSWDIVV